MDDGLKQRLIGAVVLTAVAVIFLPSIVNEDSRRRVDVQTQVPPRPKVHTVEIPDPVRPDNIDRPKPPEKMYQLVGEPELPAAPGSQAQPPRLDASGVPEAWAVQVASYQTLKRAEVLRRKLLAEGYKAYIRTVDIGEESAVRVYVGPKLDRQQAFLIKGELDKAHNITTMVVKFRP